LISATHRDLLQQVKDGAFREDLFYRLNVYPIFVPPLRERREDIPFLVRHFMDRVEPADPRRRLRGVSEAALSMLMAYDWPGNIGSSKTPCSGRPCCARAMSSHPTSSRKSGLRSRERSILIVRAETFRLMSPTRLRGKPRARPKRQQMLRAPASARCELSTSGAMCAHSPRWNWT